MRVGIGYDVHRLVKGKNLILGGVFIPYEKGLLGHSDADVLIHAIMDSILGASSLRDIGKHFPDDDITYKNISSMELLRQVNIIIKQEGYRIVNIDSVIIAQEPKISPFIEEMQKNICECLELEANFRPINIKATTEEGLGFTGEGEGIAAKAICLLE